MKLLHTLQLGVLSSFWVFVHGVEISQLRTTPDGCRALKSDSNWPAPEVWKAALPGVTPLTPPPGRSVSPDYRLRVRTAEEVQKAINFCNEHNIRVSVIATGHDFMGRSTAASGLLIDLSLLNGIRVMESFTSTVEGAPSVKPGQKANVITPKLDLQPAVT